MRLGLARHGLGLARHGLGLARHGLTLCLAILEIGTQTAVKSTTRPCRFGILLLLNYGQALLARHLMSQTRIIYI